MYFDLYRRQLSACVDPGGTVLVKVEPSSSGLMDRRSYSDGEWTEVARLVDRRITLIILSDPGHRMPVAAAEKLLAAIPRAR